jgi:hypothetical protein
MEILDMVNMLTTYADGETFVGLGPEKDNVFAGVFHPRRIADWKYQYSNSNCLQFKTLSELPLGSKYVVVLNYYSDFCNNFVSIYKFLPDSRGHLDHVRMPSRVWQDSGQGLVHWIIDNSSEMEVFGDHGSFELSKLKDAINCNLSKNITISTGSSGSDFSKLLATGANVVYSDRCRLFPNYDNKDCYDLVKIQNTWTQKILPFKSACYNRLPKPHRMITVAHIMHNTYCKDTLYSLGQWGHPQARTISAEYYAAFPYLKEELKFLTSDTVLYPSEAEAGVDLKNNPAHTVGWNHGLQTSFQLITESHFFNQSRTFITEKTYKTFFRMQPFLHMAAANTIEHLKKQGYETFDKWIDHSYDSEQNDHIRLKMVLAEYDRLNALSNHDWSNLLKQMLPKLIHNSYRVTCDPLYSPAEHLIPILLEFSND